MHAPRATPEKIKMQMVQLNEECETGEAVARKFQKMGIRGMIQSGFQCPLAQYMSGPGMCDGAHVSSAAIWLDGKRIMDLPEPLREFIADFDAGKYPDLSADRLYPFEEYVDG